MKQPNYLRRTIVRQRFMSKYEVIIYWSEDDGADVAEVPELSGCMADGATYQEALAMRKS
jgi:predicted RNase H-like HicB family nuclease